MNAKQAREWIKDSPANPNPKTELAGFGFQCGGDDPESRETAGGPWFLCAECAGRLQARGCGFSSKEAGPIWGGQIHENCAVCWPAKRQQGGAKHTPGPWSADIEDYPFRREIYIETQDFDPDAGEGERIARVFDETDNGRANAHLIAAAPDLLFALHACLAELVDVVNAEGGDESEAMKQARAAISQAEGGAQ